MNTSLYQIEEGIYEQVCYFCKGEGGIFDCGWWYECPYCIEKIEDSEEEKQE